MLRLSWQQYKIFAFLGLLLRVTSQVLQPKSANKRYRGRVVVVAQLVEWSLPILVVHGSNPVIGKILFIYWTFVYCQLCIEKTKIKKKRPGMAHFFKKNVWTHFFPNPNRVRSSTNLSNTNRKRKNFFGRLQQVLWIENTILGKSKGSRHGAL